MSCLYRIKEARSMLTDTDAKIADYVLEHSDEILNDSVQVLAKKTETSPSAVIRFSKRLGFSGFSELKVELAKEYNGSIENFTEQIKEEDSVHTLIQKTKVMNLEVVEQTYHLINEATLEKGIEAMKNASCIYLFGIGASSMVCDDLLNKLFRIGKNAVHHLDSHFQTISAANITPQDVAIGISYSGETKEVVTAMKYAKQQGAITIGITQLKKSPLSRYCDLFLYLPTEEKELRIGAISSRLASFILTDLLYLGIAKENLKETNRSLVKTRSIIKEIR